MQTDYRFTFIKDCLIVIMSFIISVILIITGAVMFEKKQCKERWTNSGKQASYEMFTGCLVETSSGKFIPEKTLRVIQ